jgi:predicted RNA binding protein YcfA (HicA-like mRNA interferase family)
MTRRDKLIDRILRGGSDADIAFDDLCTLLTHFGFALRVRGSHHLFSKSGITEKINLQRDGGKAKPYQVRQVRDVIVKYHLGGE